MKSLEELKQIKMRMQQTLNMRDAVDESDVRIIVGMATCGIAAGARPVLNKLIEETAKRGLKNVKVTQAGCAGICKYEPLVEVIVPGQEKITYVKVTEDLATKIINEHIVNGNVVKEALIQKD